MGLQTKQGASFCSNISDYQCFTVCCLGTRSCASKPLLLRCKLVIPQYLFQVSLGLKEIKRQAHDFKHNKVPLFARKPANVNVLRSAAPKLALVTASRYNCVVNTPNFDICAKFHLD